MINALRRLLAGCLAVRAPNTCCRPGHRHEQPEPAWSPRRREGVARSVAHSAHATGHAKHAVSQRCLVRTGCAPSRGAWRSAARRQGRELARSAHWCPAVGWSGFATASHVGCHLGHDDVCDCLSLLAGHGLHYAAGSLASFICAASVEGLGRAEVSEVTEHAWRTGQALVLTTSSKPHEARAALAPCARVLPLPVTAFTCSWAACRH